MKEEKDSIRQYQTDSINGIRNEFIKGNKKVLLWLSTGGGKTFIFCRMVKEAVERGRRAIIVVRGRKLVDQASQRLTRESVPHGVFMAGHWNFRPNMPVQVCSIDTLISRGETPPADLIIIDEAHMSASEGYKEFLSKYDTYIVSVTATPWVDKGLRHVADTYIHPITMQGLIDLGFLVPFRAFAPSAPDLSQVETSYSTKDYKNNQLEVAMNTGQLTGKIIDHWVEIAKDLPTLCFGVNIRHSKILAEKFRDAGIAAEHCDSDTKDAERNEVIKRLEDGRTKVVCNVGIFCTGVDIPRVGAIIMARPTQSRNLFIQQAGRGTRPFPGKETCILLDHAGNCHAHGLPTDEPELNLDGGPVREKSEKESKICKNCFAVYRGAKCPECGVEAPIPPDTGTPEESDEKLVEITSKDVDPIEKEFKRLLVEAKKKKVSKPKTWAMQSLVNKFGFELSQPYLSDFFIDSYNKRYFGNSPYRGVSTNVKFKI